MRPRSFVFNINGDYVATNLFQRQPRDDFPLLDTPSNDLSCNVFEVAIPIFRPYEQIRRIVLWLQVARLACRAPYLLAGQLLHTSECCDKVCETRLVSANNSCSVDNLSSWTITM